jgi:hypothetical protein
MAEDFLRCYFIFFGERVIFQCFPHGFEQIDETLCIAIGIDGVSVVEWNALFIRIRNTDLTSDYFRILSRDSCTKQLKDSIESETSDVFNYNDTFNL